MSLTTVQQSLLLAAYFRGNPTGQKVFSSSCDQVVTLSLFYTGNLTAAECANRFSRRSYVSNLYDDRGELRPEISQRYRELINLIRRCPDLIEGGGNLAQPADPTYTACRLTAAGDERVPALIHQFPAKPEFPNWPDYRKLEDGV